MLFDLRGSGRRRTIKVVYITLALLMGGGLVLFGIGGGTSGRPGRRHHRAQRRRRDERRFEKRRSRRRSRSARRPTRAPRPGPSSPARASTSPRRRELRPENGTYTDKGNEELARAGRAWERYLALDRTPKPDDRVASLMVQAYARPRRARQGRAGAGDRHRRPRPDVALYATLAISPTGPARPARATWPRTRRSSSPSRTCARRSRASSSGQAARPGGAGRAGAGRPTPPPRAAEPGATMPAAPL